jgi:hypothetical protein
VRGLASLALRKILALTALKHFVKIPFGGNRKRSPEYEKQCRKYLTRHMRQYEMLLGENANEFRNVVS